MAGAVVRRARPGDRVHAHVPRDGQNGSQLPTSRLQPYSEVHHLVALPAHVAVVHPRGGECGEHDLRPVEWGEGILPAEHSG